MKKIKIAFKSFSGKTKQTKKEKEKLKKLGNEIAGFLNDYYEKEIVPKHGDIMKVNKWKQMNKVMYG